MLRKTTSKQTNLFTELEKEFSVYFKEFSQKRRLILEKHPKPIFITMLICIVVSIILAFTVMRSKTEPASLDFEIPASQFLPGLVKLKSVGLGIKDVLDLQTQIKEILSKDSLTKTDSLFLEKAITRIDSINKLNHIP